MGLWGMGSVDWKEEGSRLLGGGMTADLGDPCGCC